MAVYVLRSEADALRAWTAIDAADSEYPSVRFAGWPKVVVTVPEGIGAKSARTITTIQRFVWREYCLWKHGTTNLSKLTGLDKKQTELDVEFSRPTQMVIDFSRAATAIVQAVRIRCSKSNSDVFINQQGGLFDGPSYGDAAEENWPRAAREIGLAVVRKVSPEQAARLAAKAIIVAAVALASPIVLGEVLNYYRDTRALDQSHQLRLAELERTKIIRSSGGSIDPVAHRVAERELEFDSQRVRVLLHGEYQGPFARYVQLADYARPALLELVQATTIDINGVSVEAGIAKSAAKALKRDPTHGWKAVVHAAKAIES